MKKPGDLNRKTTAKILKFLIESSEPLHTREIIRRSGLCNETVVRVLKTLAGRGWIERIQVKNRKYYFLSKNLPIKLTLKIFSLIRGEKIEEHPSLFEELFSFYASLFNHFAAFSQAVDEAIRYIQPSIQALNKQSEIVKQFNEKVNFALTFFEKNRAKIEFLRGELLTEGIDIYELDILSAMKLTSWFMKNEAAYLELRKRGLKPVESLRWAGEYKWIKLRKDLKIIPTGEWDKNVKRLFEHPPEVLRSEYGYRLTYKEILGLKD